MPPHGRRVRKCRSQMLVIVTVARVLAKELTVWDYLLPSSYCSQWFTSINPINPQNNNFFSPMCILQRMLLMHIKIKQKLKVMNILLLIWFLLRHILSLEGQNEGLFENISPLEDSHLTLTRFILANFLFKVSVQTSVAGHVKLTCIRPNFWHKIRRLYMAAPCSMWDLSPLPRDWTHAPGTGSTDR